MNNNGSSFIEAVISAAILCIITIPVISGFSQAYKNFNFSQDYYKAGLHAQSILCGILYEDADIYDLFTDSETDKYSYAVYICYLHNGVISSYDTYTIGVAAAGLSDLELSDFTADKFNFLNIEERLIIVDAYTKGDALLTRVLSLAGGGIV